MPSSTMDHKYSPAPTKADNNHKDMNGDVDASSKVLLSPAVAEKNSEKIAPPLPVVCKGGQAISGGDTERGKELTVTYYGAGSGDAGDWRARGIIRYLIIGCVLLFLAALSLLIVLLVQHRRQPEVCLSQHCVKTAAQLLDAIDFNVDPCDDFFQYACGSWNRKHIIPEDRASFTTFEKLHDELQKKLKRLLEEPQNSYDTNSTLQAKILYNSCINTSQVEVEGDSPLRNILKDLSYWPVVHPEFDETSWVLEDVIGKLRGSYNAPIFIESWVAADDKNSTIFMLQLDQASLGMPSREYYLKDEESDYKKAYLKFMIRVAVLLGAEPSEAERQMSDVLAFEMKLANVTAPQDKRLDTGALYTKMTVRELQRKVPQIDWLRYFNSFMPLTITEDEPIVSFAMEYLANMSVMVKEQPKRVVANYLLWRLILGLVPEMTDQYQQEWFQYRKVLEGVMKAPVRWEKCVKYVNDRMGLAVGRLFIKEHFDEHSKHTALEMIHNIRDAFNDILRESDWMDERTKAVAKEKADAMNERIGYPDFLLNRTEIDATYSGLTFSPSTYFENILRVEHHDAQKNLARLRKPVRKDKWEQDPAVVNAFYNPNTNDIVFPAGILQPLFYSRYFPKSLNYGGIGVVIGHEITHGFDDKGRQYDKDGNMRQWWNNETIRAFRTRAKCIVDQYSNYTLEPFGLAINGMNTQGENIADNGGLKESFKAYRKWVSLHGEEPLLPGINLTHNQLFFLNYAQIWCGLMRDQEAVYITRISVHSPGPIRVLGPLSNNKDFSEAYSCPLGSRMNPHHKCHVW